MGGGWRCYKCWPLGEPSVNTSYSQSPRYLGAVGLETIWLKHCVTPQVGTSFSRGQVLQQAFPWSLFLCWDALPCSSAGMPTVSKDMTDNSKYQGGVGSLRG